MTLSEKLLKIAENEQKVYKAGKKDEWSRWWDNFQANGNRVNYNYAFYTNAWDDDTFVPKHDIKPTSANYGFRACAITDFRQILLDFGVKFDSSGCTSFESTFSANSMTALPVISTVNCSKLSSTFNGSSKLVTIEKLILKDDGSQTFSNSPFGGLSALENIVVEGVIGNSISFANSTKLTHDSLMSIINALKDYSETGGTYTLTIGSTNLAKLTDAEKAIATQKGWTLA